MRLTVRAPATVANLGPGFDCLAMALEVRNEFVLELGGRGPGPDVEVEGEGADELRDPGGNLVVRTLAQVAAEQGRRLPPYRLRCAGRIPLERGLGSSASAVVAGLLLADRLLDLGMDPDALLDAAAAAEGHPDNVAACLRGGLVVVHRPGGEAGGWRAEPLAPHPSLRPVALVPGQERLSTEQARRALPASVPLSAAVFNASRAALAVLALTARPDLLAEALEDRLHQPHRLPLIPRARGLFERLRAEGIAVCVAGSGPSLLAFEEPGRALPDPGPGWRLLRAPVAPVGATLEEG